MEADLITVLKTEIMNKFGKTGVDLSEVHQGSSKGMKVIQGFVEKLNHAGFDNLNSMLGDLSAIEAGTQHGAKEQGLLHFVDVGFLDSWRFKREDLFESMHQSKTFALTHSLPGI